jgi:hypothetical protein
VNRIYVAGGTMLGGTIAIGALMYLDFFGLFEPELDRWQQPVPRELIEPQGDPFGVEHLEQFVSSYDDELIDLFTVGPPAYSQQQADAWAVELKPVVERVCDRAFTSPPVLRVVDRPTLAAALSPRVREQYEGFLPALPDSYLERFVSALAAWHSMASLGVYDPVDKVLYAVPTNVRAVMAAVDMDERHYQPFVKLVVAHELTHALQDQKELVGAELGIAETSIETSRLLAAGAIPMEDEWLADIYRAVEVLYEEIYLGGRDFIAHHHDDAGMDRVWEILAAPPAQTSMITSPATYAAQPRSGMGYYDALVGIHEVFGRGWTVGASTRLNAFELHRRYAYLDGSQRDRLVASMEYVHMMTLTRWPDEGNATLYVIVLRDVEPFYEVLASTWDDARKLEALPGIEADVNRLIPDVHEDTEAGGPLHTVLHLRRGPLVVDLRTFGGELGNEDYARIARSLFDRLGGVADH